MAKAYIIESVFGLLAFNEEGKLIDKALFPRKPEEASALALKIESGELTGEAEKLIERLKAEGYSPLVFENERLAKTVKNRFGVEIEVESPSKAGENLRSNLPRFAVEAGFVSKPEEFYELLREITTWISRIRVREAAARRDKIIIQAVSVVDELDKMLNVLAGRIREWYGLHFPELNKLIDSHETYARLVVNLGGRENFKAERLKELGLPKSKAEAIEEVSKTSIGAPMDEDDLKYLQTVGRLYLEMASVRRQMAGKVDALMDEVAPNVKALVGSTLGARLISLAGGLRELATLPSSTVQVLGAEKALFRALRSGAKPPKHGVIFQHPAVHQAPRWQRGKIARALAGKISIAAKVDAFGGTFVGDRLKADLEKRISEIKEKYRAPPPRAKPRKKTKKKSR